MKCTECGADVAENTKYCSQCGHAIDTAKIMPSRPYDKKLSDKGRPRGSGAVEDHLKPPSGLRRTLSTELVARQSELDSLTKLNDVIESRTYQADEVIIQKGDRNRDLLFLTEGLVEISTKEKSGNLILNKIRAPHIFGDIGFLLGSPRTATARAKTKVKLFILKYENLKSTTKEFPEWLQPLLRAFVSGIKELHDEITKLERKISELEDSKSNRGL